MNTEKITIKECEERFASNGETVIINDGKVIGFESRNERNDK